MSDSTHLPFSVEIDYIGKFPPGRKPSHRLFIEPLIEVAFEIVVAGEVPKLDGIPVPPHSTIGRFAYLDLSKPVLRGYELFWSLNCGRRPPIGIGIPFAAVEWEKLFNWSGYLGVSSSMNNTKKTYSTSSIKYFSQRASGQNIYVTFNNNCGLKYADVWAESPRYEELMAVARSNCRTLIDSARFDDPEKQINVDSEEYRRLI